MKAADAETDALTHPCQQHMAQRVKVHKFLVPHIGFRENLAFNFYATKAAIGRFRGTPILDTAIEVDLSTLDDNGVYDPARSAMTNGGPAHSVTDY